MFPRDLANHPLLVCSDPTLLAVDEEKKEDVPPFFAGITFPEITVQLRRRAFDLSGTNLGDF
jgi:hypothetical protein